MSSFLQVKSIDDNGESNAPGLFTDLNDTASKGTFSDSAFPDEYKFAVRLAAGGAACCVPGADDRRIVLKFKVYNPSAPQAGTSGVSISARGVPIMESAMRTGLAGFMRVETPRFTTKTFGPHPTPHTPHPTPHTPHPTPHTPHPNTIDLAPCTLPLEP